MTKYGLATLINDSMAVVKAAALVNFISIYIYIKKKVKFKAEKTRQVESKEIKRVSSIFRPSKMLLSVGEWRYVSANLNIHFFQMKLTKDFLKSFPYLEPLASTSCTPPPVLPATLKNR
jgi:hypothetical protein